MQEHLDAYAERSAISIAVAAGQPLYELREYAERSSINYPLLADEDCSIIKSYGVYHWFALATHNLAYTIVRPATFIIDRRGIITYTYIGSSQFDLAEQEEILVHLDSLTP